MKIKELEAEIKKSTIRPFIKSLKKEIRFKFGISRKFRKELKKASKYVKQYTVSPPESTSITHRDSDVQVNKFLKLIAELQVKL